MNLSLDEKLKMLKIQSREILKKECPSSLVRDAETSEQGYSSEFYFKMAQLGWLGLGIPEQWGGTGGDLVDLTILYEEIGRALVPGPHFVSAVICGQILLSCGSEKQKKTLLPQIASGQSIFTLARYEQDTGEAASCINLSATPEDQDYILEGIKLFVPYGHVSDYLICVTRTEKSQTKEDGITLFLVNTKSDGISYTPLITLAGDKQSEVLFQKVRVSKSNMLGKLHSGWSPLREALNKGIVIQCAQMVGGAEKALEISLEHSKQRIQFDRPIGSFQAVQHKFADMALMVNASRYITYKAACKINDGEACSLEVAMAKAYTADACRQVTKEAHQILGGYGFVTDHDMNLYYRRIKSFETDLGDVDYQIEEVAQQMGL